MALWASDDIFDWDNDEFASGQAYQYVRADFAMVIQHHRNTMNTLQQVQTVQLLQPAHMHAQIHYLTSYKLAVTNLREEISEGEEAPCITCDKVLV